MQRAKNIRLFQNPFLERFTYIHPLVPLVYWTPIIAACLYYAFAVQDLSTGILWASCFGGLFTWTFAEYVLHRFIFHYPAKSKLGKFIVYLFHGNHHEVPEDSRRLVMPPLPGTLIAGALFIIFRLFLGDYVFGFFGFFMIGYLCYDYIHYYSHQFVPQNAIGKYLRNYHLQHHYRDIDARFGVSSPLWDIIFRTYNSKN